MMLAARVIGAVAVIVAMAVPVGMRAAQAAPAGAAPTLTKSSGMDASCPAASTADAAAATVSAPADARAIGGDSSATVVWCPPASGAGSVTSYTVTAQPGGEQVTASVPNDWAIIDGLSNGTSYTFIVTAVTGTGSGAVPGPAATTRPVTPAPLPRPRHVLLGAPQTVSYDQYSMLIGGKRVFITAGEFDPWRTPSPGLWLDDLQKMRADGYNAVTVYFDWDYSSPSPGRYNFTGVRDMNKFLNMAQQAGLYVIARPGPYINAETDGGGIPAWVLTSEGYRSDVQPYLSAALQWFSQIDAIIAPHQVSRGGDVIAYQIENEYTGHGTASNQYMADLEQQAVADGITVPFTFNQCCGAQTFTSGLGAVNISGTDNYPVGFNCSNTAHFGTPGGYPSYPGMPVYLPEFQGGSFDGWGGSGYANCYTMTGPDFENVFYKSNIARGVTMQSNYMGVGGTNWGWLPDPDVYTSYDYGAAISETGEIGAPSDPSDIAGSKYGENKLINDFETSVAPLAQTSAAAAPTPDNPAITAMARVNPSDGTEFVYLRQGNASSTATATTHIALNTDEAAGYTYDDTDPALTYSGTWTHAGPSAGYTNGDYDSTESFSTQAGASMTVTFTGTAVQWIGPKNTNGGIATVSVDGGTPANVDTYAPGGKQFQQVLFSDTGLPAGTHTLTITVTGNKDSASSADTVVVDAINVPTAAQLADFFPVVPQAGTITLDGRDSRLLVANYAFGGQQLVYSTSELMTQATIGGQDTALLYDPAGTDGETVLTYTSQPTVNVVSGNVTTTWDASSGDLRLDYTHSGLQEVEITGGGRAPLLLLIADTTTAEDFWPEQTSAGPVLVEGAYLVRTAVVKGGTLLLAGDTSTTGDIRVWAGATVRSVNWNGTPLSVTGEADGSLSGTVPGPAPVTLPVLTGWKFAYETEQAQPGFDDSGWTLADHAVSNASSPSTPVLYASDYGYDHGFVWYRGHFTATGGETGVTLTVDGIAPTGGYSVWLNGAFLGSGGAAGPSTQTFAFPAGAVSTGDNVIAVLVENTGNPEGPSGEKVGLYSASLVGSAQPITWRLSGASPSLQDPVRGIMNAAGLYGSGNGWDLPGYPDADWTRVTLPDSWASRGVPAGVGWYRTTFSLHLPPGQYVPIDVQVGGPGPGAGTADYRAFIYVNGWLIGRYVNNVGPQHQFYVPAGILSTDGENTIAIADWGLDSTTGGLDQVSLVAIGDQTTSLRVPPVASPGYSARVYGPPTAPSPTLGVVPSTMLASGTFTVAATVSNPAFRPLEDASVALNVPSGWTVTPSSGSLGTVPARSTASVTFTVTAPSSGLTPGTLALLATASFSGGSLQNAATLQVPYPSLAATFNNTGITDDSNPSPSSSFIGFDGIGTSYSAEGLAADGITPGATVPGGGLSFTWPSAAVATPDNTMAEGQTIAVSGSGSSLGFLAAANNSPESGTGTIYYTDGTTQTFTLDVGNFWYPSGSNGNPSNTPVASVNYANYPTGPTTHTIYLFEQSVPLAAGKTVEAVQLPSLGNVAGYNAALHIFAMTIG
jgi:beta-galactosidase GanA